MKNIKNISISGQGARILTRFFVPVLLLVLLAPPDCHADLADLLEISAFVPEQDIVMKGESRNDWKDLWDEGRVLVRAGEFSAAEKKY
jgi:hypothetical protein